MARPLGELCEVLDYMRKPITKRDRTEGQYPYYGATGIVDFVGDFIFDEKLVLVGEDGAKWASGERTAFIISGRSWVNNHAHVLRPRRHIVVDEWLAYYLTHIDLGPFVGGLTVPKLNQGSLREIPIPVPPLDEQKRIVAILDEAFEGIAKAAANVEKNIANTRALFQAVLDRTYSNSDTSWTNENLSTALSEQPRNGWSPPAEFHSSTGTPVLTLSSVTGFRFKSDKIKFTSAPVDLDRHYWVGDGDLLIARSNTPSLVGHVAVAGGILNPTIYPDLIMRMRADGGIAKTRYLYYQLRTSALREEIMRRARGANPTMVKLSKQDVQSLPIKIAPLPRQEAIVLKLDGSAAKTEALAEVYTAELGRLVELKQSLLHKAFSGQLTSADNIAA